jgi:2-polyprenyl-3-methyl-5-hydroxy-6-metoxy-1,4-benzoquinol methylase
MKRRRRGYRRRLEEEPSEHLAAEEQLRKSDWPMAEVHDRAHWESQADAWITLAGSDPDYELLNKPSFLELVPRPGRLTLDVGCGEGRLARELTAGGHRVIGVDGSLTLARAADAADPRTPVALADATPHR